MTGQSIALFAHLSGMLALFVVLAIEWFAMEQLRASDTSSPPSFSLRVLRLLPRLTAVAVVLTLVSGVLLALRYGVIRSGWVGVSFAAMLLMGGLGAAALRPLLRTLNERSSRDDNVATLRRAASRPIVRASLR